MDPPTEDTKPAGSCEPSNLTEDKKSPQDLVNDKKGIAHGMLGTFFADLKEKKVLKEREIQTLGETVNVIVDKTEGLVGDLTEKTQMV
ncbi:inactive caspase-12, partial [Lynx pardinus]